MVIPSPVPDGTLITVVHSPACHFCDDARLGLTEIAGEFPVSVEYIESGEVRGRVLLQKHRAAMFPLVLVDGARFSSGRLPAKKLRNLLASRAVATVA